MPAALLVVFGAWIGTFYGHASFVGSTIGIAVLLVLVLSWVLGPRGFRFHPAHDDPSLLDPPRFDPLRLGRAGRWCLVALLVTVVASWWASPVPRAGRVGVVLLPAFLLLPTILAGTWRDRGDQRIRRWGLRALSMAVASVAAWSLVDHLAFGSPRAAMPLGHHNLLAMWLLAVLPLAVLPMRERTPWRGLGWTVGVLGGAALLATRSLLGGLGLALLTLLALGGWVRRQGHTRQPPQSPRSRLVVFAVACLGVVAALGALFGPRLGELAGGRDTSAQARAVYWQAGVAGIVQRPWLGWGPGSTPWTVAEHWRPRPAVNPPGEAVGQLHSQPLQVAYEVGLPGLALALACCGLFGWRRWREARTEGVAGGASEVGARDPALTRAGLAGLAASGVAALGTAALDVPAIPVVWAVAAAAALAGGEAREEPRQEPGRGPDDREDGGASPAEPGIGLKIGFVLYGVLVAAALLGPVRGHFHYDRFLRLEGPAAARTLDRALAADPSFPWYRARRAALEEPGERESSGKRGASARQALEAARDARGVAALWLLAGYEGTEIAAPWAGEALARACQLDPLAALAPFHRLRWDPDAAEAARWGGRALLAEPRLLAATYWDGRPRLWKATVASVKRSPAPDGWKVTFLEAVEWIESERQRMGGAGDDRSELAHLSAALDREAATSLALHLFHRRPRGRPLAPVTVHRRLAEGVSLPPVTALPEISAEVLNAGLCRAE